MRPAVAVIKIDSLNAANVAAEALRDGRTIICNYEEIEASLAQRASDFIRGAATVLHANFCSVSSKITVFVPSGVSLLAELPVNKDQEENYKDDIYSQLYIKR